MVTDYTSKCRNMNNGKLCGWCQINRTLDLKIINRIKREGKVDGRRLGNIKKHHAKIRQEILLSVKNNKAYV